MGTILEFPRQPDPYQLSQLERLVIASLHAIYERDGAEALDKAAAHLLAAVSAVLVHERGRARLTALLDLIEAVT